MLLRTAAADWLPKSIRERRVKSLYDDHFLKVWQRLLDGAPSPKGSAWARCYSHEAWETARRTVQHGPVRAVFAVVSAWTVWNWIELNSRQSSGN